ncbi:hypothetical protein RCO48_31825 [Peribacillus frigoritolerans]|nr:hypothetical protein [Peribacillus frigoritolerans]
MKFKMMYSFLNADLQLIEKELEAAIEADSTVLRGSFPAFTAIRWKTDPSGIRPIGCEVWQL